MRIAPLVLALAVWPAALPAQEGGLTGTLETGAPQFGVGLGPTIPLGEFSRYVGVGGQLDGSFLFNVSRGRDVVAMRVNLTYVIYNQATERVPLTSSSPLLLVDLTTNNSIFSFDLGPQITFGGSRLRPYVGGHAGLSYFFTETTASGSSSSDVPFANTTNFDDWTLGVGAVAGTYISLSSVKAVSLDVSVRFEHNATVHYLHAGSITEHPDGTVSFAPAVTPVDLLLIRVGVAFGSRR